MSDDRSPRHLVDAAASRDLALVKQRLAEGVDVNEHEPDGTTALWLAAYYGDLEIADALINAGAKTVIRMGHDDFSVLVHAAEMSNNAVVRRLVAAGANVNFQSRGSKPGDWWSGPAILYTVDDPITTQCLLEAGADPNCYNEDGNFPLYNAVIENNVETVRLLLRFGADVRQHNADLNTILHQAAHYGSEDVMQPLIDAGADLNARNSSNETPLLEAILRQHFGVAKILIEAGAQVNYQGFPEETPLHSAARMGQLETVQRLIAAGAELHAKDDRDATPLMLAQEGGHEAVAQFLLSLEPTAEALASAQAEKVNAGPVDNPTVTFQDD